MKKPVSPLVEGLLLGIIVGAALAEIFAANKKPDETAVKPDNLDVLKRKRIVALSENRIEDAEKLKTVINKLKYNEA